MRALAARQLLWIVAASRAGGGLVRNVLGGRRSAASRRESRRPPPDCFGRVPRPRLERGVQQQMSRNEWQGAGAGRLARTREALRSSGRQAAYPTRDAKPRRSYAEDVLDERHAPAPHASASKRQDRSWGQCDSSRRCENSPDSSTGFGSKSSINSRLQLSLTRSFISACMGTKTPSISRTSANGAVPSFTATPS